VPKTLISSGIARIATIRGITMPVMFNTVFRAIKLRFIGASMAFVLSSAKSRKTCVCSRPKYLTEDPDQPQTLLSFHA